jgi:hypothetical protein
LLFNVALLLVSAMGTLLFAEAALRLLGKRPGYVPRYSRFKVVERLEVDSSFYTDGEGVFKANPDYKKWSGDVYINSDGFRSCEFNRPHPAHQPKILFLGDSFTWGSSARPITKSFVDLVGEQGFVTFNLGIPGTDPNQYAYLAEKYAPLLKPDIVAVMFYIGNDFIAPRPMLPYKNLYHVTNAKFLYAFDAEGNHMSPQQAYDYYLAKNNAAADSPQNAEPFKSTLRTALTKTVVGTYLVVAASKIKRKLFADSENEAANPVYDRTRESLLRIKAASERVGARFMMFVIPMHPRRQQPANSIRYHQSFFKEFKAYIPDFLDESDYMKLPNSHFNNSGHRKYADFILKAIGELNAPVPNAELSNGN